MNSKRNILIEESCEILIGTRYTITFYNQEVCTEFISYLKDKGIGESSYRSLFSELKAIAGVDSEAGV